MPLVSDWAILAKWMTVSSVYSWRHARAGTVGRLVSVTGYLIAECFRFGPTGSLSRPRRRKKKEMLWPPSTYS